MSDGRLPPELRDDTSPLDPGYHGERHAVSLEPRLPGEDAPRLRGVILDVDGTLIESNEAHARAWHEALAEQGVDVPLGRLQRLIGKGGDKLLAEAAGLSEDDKRGRRAKERRGERFRQRYLDGLRPTNGARALLERMRADGLSLAVASSAEPGELQALLEKAGVADLVQTQTSSGDAAHSKPDPDIVTAALDRLGLGPDEVLMLGDTPWDVESAARAGIRTIAVRCSGWDVADLGGALAVYDDPADILARYELSPFALPTEVEGRPPTPEPTPETEALVALHEAHGPDATGAESTRDEVPAS